MSSKNKSGLVHNKKRNCALVYEFLVRQMAKQLLEKDVRGYSKSLRIAKDRFSEGTLLAKEKSLIDVARSSRGLSETAARAVLGEIGRYAREIDPIALEHEKSALIRDLNRAFGQSVFEHRVPDYRLLASLSMFVDSFRKPGKLDESVQRVQLEEKIVEFMTTSSSAPDSFSDQSVDGLVCRLAAEKFEKKYGKSLSEGQRYLLGRYIKAEISGSYDELLSKLEEESKMLLEKLDAHRSLKEVSDDPVASQKFDEARENLAKLAVRGSDPESLVEEIMLYQNLVTELESK